MRVKRWGAAAATAVLAAGFGIAGVAPASAQELGTYDACQEGVIVGQAGDTFTLVFDGCALSGFYYGDNGITDTSVTFPNAPDSSVACLSFVILKDGGAGAYFGDEIEKGGILFFADEGKTTAQPAVCGDPPPSLDSDGDGVADDVDICPGGDDTADGDGDGVPNACDVCPSDAKDECDTGDGLDADNDGILDDGDLCPGTVLPDELTGIQNRNRYIANAAGEFVDGAGRDSGYTLEDTGGCSATQIIDRAGLGAGHSKFGISRGALEDWIASLAD